MMAVPITALFFGEVIRTSLTARSSIGLPAYTSGSARLSAALGVSTGLLMIESRHFAEETKHVILTIRTAVGSKEALAWYVKTAA